MIKTYGYSILALIAFAANSLFCRLALMDENIDAASFTLIRMLSGAAMFVLLLSLQRRIPAILVKPTPKRMLSALMLFIYAAAFSFAYITLETATGALVLFGTVQLSMLLIGWFKGSRFTLIESVGIAVSFGGLVYLLYPQAATPSLNGFVLMTFAGFAWGVYTLLGRGSSEPMIDTASNFVLTIPLVVLLTLVCWPSLDISAIGALWAVLSGVLASALGYTIWYAVLPSLRTTSAAVMQLSVPVIAAIGGVLLVAEPITQRLLIASVLVLGGILLVVTAKKRS